MHHDSSDLGSLVLFRIFAKERTLSLADQLPQLVKEFDRKKTRERCTTTTRKFGREIAKKQNAKDEKVRSEIARAWQPRCLATQCFNGPLKYLLITDLLLSSVVKSTPNQSFTPITKDDENSANQSNVKAKTCEIESRLVMVLLLIGRESGTKFFPKNHNTEI